MAKIINQSEARRKAEVAQRAANTPAAAIRRGEEAVKAAFAAIPRNATGVVRMAYDAAACYNARHALAKSFPNTAATVAAESWFETTINALQEREKEMIKNIDHETAALDKGEWYAQKPPLPADVEFILAAAVKRRREALYKASKAAAPSPESPMPPDAPYRTGNLRSWWSETHGADHDRIVARIADEEARRAEKAPAGNASKLTHLVDGLPIIDEHPVRYNASIENALDACEGKKAVINDEKVMLVGRNEAGTRLYVLWKNFFGAIGISTYDGVKLSGMGMMSSRARARATALLEGGD